MTCALSSSTARFAASARGSGPRVGLFEGRTQPLVGDMGVDLRGGQRRMPEHLLDAAEVRTSLKQVSGHGMPESVRTEIGRALG